MSKFRNVATALMAAASMHVATAAPTPDTAASAPEAAPAPLTLVSSCQTTGHWTSVPENDTSSMNALGRKMCVDGVFSNLLNSNTNTRAKTFSQLGLAYDHLSQRAQLGKPVEDAPLQDVNLPNVFVAHKPYASENGSLVYSFVMTVSRPADEAGPALKEERIEGKTRIGKITGLMEVAPGKPLAKASL